MRVPADIYSRVKRGGTLSYGTGDIAVLRTFREVLRCDPAPNFREVQCDGALNPMVLWRMTTTVDKVDRVSYEVSLPFRPAIFTVPPDGALIEAWVYHWAANVAVVVNPWTLDTVEISDNDVLLANPMRATVLEAGEFEERRPCPPDWFMQQQLAEIGTVDEYTFRIDLPYAAYEVERLTITSTSNTTVIELTDSVGTPFPASDAGVLTVPSGTFIGALGALQFTTIDGAVPYTITVNAALRAQPCGWTFTNDSITQTAP